MWLIATRVEKRRSCAAVELPERDAELLGLVGEVGGDAGARKHDDADRHYGDLRDLAGVGPGGGDALGALRAAAVEQHHAGMLGVDLVEPVPDGAVVVEVETAREGDLGAGRQQHLGLATALGGNEVAAVDQRRCESAMIDHRSGAWAPG